MEQTSPNNLSCELCIIGAGSGGLSVAAGAAQLGLDTILIEKAKMGGDCLNTGCIPSKALLSIAKQSEAAAKIVGRKHVHPDYAESKTYVQNVIDQIAPHDSVERFEGLGVRVIKGEATFIDKKNVQVGSERVQAKYFVIATGSRANIPPIDGLNPDHIFTNENIFQLKDKPEHLVIIGGGPIGIEMAYAHRHMGCRVSVLDMGSILPKDDPDLVGIIRAELLTSGIEIIEHAHILRVVHDDQPPHKATIFYSDQSDLEHKIEASHVLVAAGRRVNIDGLALDAAGIIFNQNGIRTDKRLRTNHKHIFAIGDVAGGPQFTHVAGYHAGIVIRNICFKLPAKVDYSALPWVTYTSPELAHVGLNESDAIQEHGEKNIDTVFFDLGEIDRAVAENTKAGGIKIIINKRNKRILGASILAPHAGEMISLWGLAIQKKMKLQDITSLIIPYPGYSELSKRGASRYFTPQLFSDRTRKIVRWLQALPF